MRFSRAIVRPPAPTFATGLTSSGLGPPDLPVALSQHEAYCRALERLGVALIRLPADPEHPDSTFVEDAAVVIAGRAILTRPGAPTRAGEVDRLRPALEPWFGELERVASPGTLDGGDVCEAGSHVFIGRSGRTNRDGGAQLAAWLRARDIEAHVVDIRGLPALLHLKTGLSWLGGRSLLACAGIAEHPALAGWRVIAVPAGEDYAANAVLANGVVLLPEGFPRTADLVAGAGHEVVTLCMSEFQKMDGGLSCLSLRW